MMWTWNGIAPNSFPRFSSEGQRLSRPGVRRQRLQQQNAAIDHMRSWALGSPKDDWVSMGVISDGSYGIEPGLIYSFPCRCQDGEWEIVQGLEISEFSREKMDATAQELIEERDAVSHLLS